jgi:hypothetical protein
MPQVMAISPYDFCAGLTMVHGPLAVFGNRYSSTSPAHPTTGLPIRDKAYWHIHPDVTAAHRLVGDLSSAPGRPLTGTILQIMLTPLVIDTPEYRGANVPVTLCENAMNTTDEPARLGESKVTFCPLSNTRASTLTIIT